MEVSASSPAHIVLVLLSYLFGSATGVPPEKEDPLLTRVAPDQCLAYIHWAGSNAPTATATNATERLVAEPEIRATLAKLDALALSSLKLMADSPDPQSRLMAELFPKLVRGALTRPGALYIGNFGMKPAGVEIEAGLLVRYDDDLAAVVASLEKLQTQIPKDAVSTATIDGLKFHVVQAPIPGLKFTWGARGKYLVIGIGEGVVEKIFERARKPAAKWLTELRAGSSIKRLSSIAYFDVQAILKTAEPYTAPQPIVPILLDSLGLSGVTKIQSVTGLDEAGSVSHSLIGLDGKGRGLFGLAEAEPLTADDLSQIPADATFGVVWRLDLSQVTDLVISIASKIEPGLSGRFERDSDDFRKTFGFDWKDDLLNSIGDKWRVYNSPGEGGLLFSGLTMLADVKDHAKLTAAHDKLLAAIKAEIARAEKREAGDDEAGPYRYRRSRTPRLQQTTLGTHTIHYLVFPGGIVSPAWCVTEKQMIVALYPQNVKAVLSRGADFKSLAGLTEMKSQFAADRRVLAAGYADAAKLTQMLYPVAQIALNAGLTELQRELARSGGPDLDLDITILPSAPTLTRHMQASTFWVGRTEAGLVMESRQTLPAVNPVMVAPVSMAMLLPALTRVRASARDSQSMNNMRQIQIALLSYEAANGKFPPAFTVDKDGKPLLSWRVLILPYIEEASLRDRFKMDEPWDSENNRKLLESTPAVFSSPGKVLAKGQTCYQTIRTKDSGFPPSGKAMRSADIKDGLSRTICLVETSSEKAVPWTKPDDFIPDELMPIKGLVEPGKPNFLFSTFDGAVHRGFRGIDPTLLSFLFSVADGKSVDPDALDGSPRPYRKSELKYEDRALPVEPATPDKRADPEPEAPPRAPPKPTPEPMKM